MSGASSLPDRAIQISDYGQERGGASRLALMLAGGLRARGVPVTVFSGNHGAAETGAGADQAGIAGAALLERGRASAIVSGLWNRQAVAELRAYLRDHDSPRAVYHVHGFMQTLSPAIFAALHPVRERVVIHAHDYFLACPNGAYFDFQDGAECARVPLSAGCSLRHCDKRSYPQKLWRLGRQHLLNRLMRDFLSDATVILPHDGMRAYLERGGRRIAGAVTLANPATPFLTGPARPAAQSGFLFVGDIHAYKGVFVLARAARQAGVPLVMAGDGQDRAALQREFPEITFAGWQDRAGLTELAARARAVVVPSLGPEPFGLALVEALACGLPVIVSDRALLAAEVVGAGAGLSARAGDRDDLARALARLAADDALVAQMAARAWGAQAQFGKTAGQWCDDILTLYDRVLTRARQRAASGPAPEGVTAQQQARIGGHG
ncbi:MAG: glycosyltransferase family 4 protein [Rhodobacteraceae bacterium]|nr:glycosyltransferase family 4 protein [Paracoccaceae bacterium]